MNQNDTYTPPNPFLEADKPIDLRSIVYKYFLQYWYLYILGLAVAMSIAFIRLRYATKQYQVRGTILIKSPDSGSAESLSQEAVLSELGLYQGNKNVQNEIQILKSRTLMQEVVERLKIFIIYELEGRIVSGEQYLDSPILLDTFVINPGIKNFNIEAIKIDYQRFALVRGDDVIKEIAYGDTLHNDYGWFVFRANAKSGWGDNKAIIKFRNPEEIAQGYANRLSIKTVGEWSSILELTLKDPVPTKAADIINTLIEVYNEAAIKDKNSAAINTYDFINERLRLLTAELSEAENEVEQFKTRNVIPSNIASNVDLYMQEFSANDNELARLRLQNSILDNLEAGLTSDVGNYEPLPLNTIAGLADLTNQISQYNNLLQERKRILLTLKENHPRVIQISDELAANRLVILNTLRNGRSNLQRSIRALESRNQQLQGRLRSFPSIERDLLEITRQKNIKESLYVFLLQKREETAISMSVAVSSARVIDAARSTGGPIEPKPNLYYTISLVLGLGLPLCFAVLKDLLNSTIQSPDDIKNNAQAPLLGSIGMSKTDGNIVVSANSRSAIAEMFRMLRTNLQFMLSGQTPPVILVTSGASGEGKTFITINLGVSISISGKKTIVLSLDLRKPKVGRYLEQSETAYGITTYLIGEADITDIIKPSGQHDNLYFIPSGPIPPNPAELLLQERMRSLFDYLGANFDFILIDTPPVGLVSDALLLNEYTTGTLFITRFAQTPKDVLEFADDLYRSQKLRNMAFVLNAVKNRAKYGYSKYGYYSYGYGYGYGYYEEDGKKGKTRENRGLEGFMRFR